jgi:hypothetical protein
LQLAAGQRGDTQASPRGACVSLSAGSIARKQIMIEVRVLGP